MSKYVPMKQKKRFDEPLWMDNGVKKCVQKKKDSGNKIKQSDRAIDREEYKEMVKKVKKVINKAGYMANTSRGWVGRGGNARFRTFKLDHHGPTDGWTDQRTNGPTDRRTHPLIQKRKRI